jgi:hypothetical protein
VDQVLLESFCGVSSGVLLVEIQLEVVGILDWHVVSYDLEKACKFQVLAK